ncbi:MAG: twin-arginine translocation signal domain-containing protein, partial [Kordiimonadaceae bacterium]|nr:twin-arginine translocation signal domain-containing protein [Kordiimonadaceae bacterium]
MTSENKTTRRSFIKKTAIAAAGFTIVPRHVLGQGLTAPSDQLNIAVIGGGGKGYSDAVNAWDNGNSRISAICDVDWNEAKRAFDKFPNAKMYKDYRKLLDEM